jgi:hypothetical protein
LRITLACNTTVRGFSSRWMSVVEEEEEDEDEEEDDVVL